VIVEIEGQLVSSLRHLGRKTTATELEWAGFPYRTPRNHYNVPGNRHLAELVFNLLTERASGSIEMFRTTDIEASDNTLSSAEQRPLDSYRSVAISNGQQELGVFGVQKGEAIYVARSFRECDVQALLALSAHASLLDALYLRLPLDLDPSARLALFVEATGDSIELGRVETPFPGLPIRVADLSDVFVRPLSFRTWKHRAGSRSDSVSWSSHALGSAPTWNSS
jgi:hypothetical protein